MTSPDKDFDTYIAQEAIAATIKSVANLKKDVDKDKRLANHLCRWCYYLRKNISGCALTRKACNNCGVMVNYASIATDKICIDCAKLSNRCCRCNSLMSV
jgi:hypothetical protein